MSSKITAVALALAVMAAAFASAPSANAGSNGYNWVPFFCKDNPGDTQCRKR
jgi:hypothetical protein